MAKNTFSTLRIARDAAGLSQSVLAEKAGTSKTHLQRIEHGQQDPTVTLAIAIARALGKQVEDIFPVRKESSRKS